LQLPTFLGANQEKPADLVPTSFHIVEGGIVHASTPDEVAYVQHSLNTMRQLLTSHSVRHQTLRGLPSNWVTIGYGKDASDYLKHAIETSKHAVFRRY
jgi:hypothetical protein